MTDRLYYTDPYLREFEGVIAAIDRRGDQLVAVLDRTCFYPTSGGQPFDVGTLGDHRVVDVIDQEDGSVAHVLENPNGATPASSTRAPILQAGDRVRGAIDWPRRFDHMQQHTGQHVLSAAFDRLFKVRTVSFHLGAVAATIDLAREVSAKEITAAEDAANDVVWQDRPVSIRYATAEEAAQLPLRKEPVREGTLRLIDVENFDLSACGGTHVARTGAIGTIVVGAVERFKGGSRIEFFCGGRAVKRFRALRDTTGATTKLLSAGLDDLPGAIEHLQAEAREQKRALVALHSELARFRAIELAAAAEPIASGRVVLKAIDADAPGLKALASAVCANAGFAVVLISTARPALVVVCRSADVSANAKEILTALTAKFGGRGGGSPEMAQGGGLDAPSEAIIAEARRRLLQIAPAT
ncbi:MAG TPA: DHHA1 domain-containing protein [Vicinamibacterales bacterium]